MTVQNWLPIMLLAASVGTPTSGATPAPNVVLIFTDDQGMNDVSCYGSEIPTPHIDSLARDGLRLTQFYAASAICTPSRFGLLTGRNPSRSRDRLLSALMFLGDVDKRRGLRQDETTIATVLRASGYDTALIGKWHLGHGQAEFDARRHGFDHTYGHTAGCVDFFTLCYGNTPDWYRNGELLDETGYATDLITDEAVRYLGERDPARPFFLFIPYNAPHFGKGWDDGNNRPVNILQPHPRDLKRVKFIADPTRRKYAAKVVALDDGIGRVLHALDANGQRENTLVIFMTDHGGDANYGGDNRPFRAGKATLFEGGIRVPCLVRWPGKVKPGTHSNEVTWAIDWFPTLCALAGAKTEGQGLDGMDISPVLHGGRLTEPRELFWELGAHTELDRGHWMALRRGPWKYVRTPQESQWLFNLEDDPGEQQNLAGQEPQRFERLRQRANALRDLYRGLYAPG